jgi:hypothetical protein
MGSFLASCRELRYLILGENKGMTGTSFCILPPTLRCLSLRECYGLDRNALTGIRQNCANLTELVFDRVDTVSANDLNIMFGGLKE